MAKLEVVEVITRHKLSDVRPGDVFRFIKEHGSRVEGELLVVKSVRSPQDIEYYPSPRCAGNYGSTEWMQQCIDDGVLEYIPQPTAK